ncbi:cohesin subunit SA-1 isoform 1-T3 [Syngnathus typhle]
METSDYLSSTSSTSSLDDLSDSDDDFELPVKITKRKIQAEASSLPPKKPRHNDALRKLPRLSSSPNVSSAETSQGRQSFQDTPRPDKSELDSDDPTINAKNIYDAVSSGKSDLMTVVDEWLDYYKQTHKQGLLVLINFIVQCCGCQGVVSREMLDSMQNAEIIATLTRQFDRSLASYPLSGAGSSSKRFRAGLCKFASILVRLCQNSLIYDEYLFASLLSLLIGLSDCQVRAFRHTSTLIAMKLMSGIVEVVVAVSNQMQTIQRYYNVEMGKDMEDQSSQRLEELQASITELLRKKEELSSLMTATFRGIFVHRYRDRVDQIRAACMEELGVWIKKNPENFLNDGCLKYLGWMLNDKQSVVRLQCVRSLQNLYTEKKFIVHMELFTNRFKKRMLNMVMDKQYEIAVEVIKLLLQIQQSTVKVLQEEECAHIYTLVYAAQHSLASAAGLFLYLKLKSVIDSENEQGINYAFFQVLINFYVQCKFHEHAIYLVDSLWDVAAVELKDWEGMTTLLLREDGLTNVEEDTLIELMVCAIRRAMEATPPVGRIWVKKGLSAKQMKTREQDRQRITTHFIPLLSQLLAKYSADPGKVKLLLQVPLYFNLDMSSSAQWMEKHLDQILTQICLIVEKHTENAVLEACSKLINTLCSDSHTFSSRAHLAFSQLFDNLTEHFNTYFSDQMQAPTDDVFSAAMVLKRMAALVSARNLSTERLFDSCTDLLKSRMESRHFDKELMVAALRCSAFHLMWAKVNLPSLPTKEEVKRLKKEVAFFCQICQECLSIAQTEIRDQAFELLCDLLLLYRANTVRSEPGLQNVYYVPSHFLTAEMAVFLLDYIFMDETEEEADEEAIKHLQKKRRLLAGYCKLFIFGVMDLSAATNVYKYYDKNYKDFGDIIKETITKTKLINPVLSARSLCLTVQQVFTEMLVEGVNKRNIDEIKDLAKKLAMTFGNNLPHVRKPLVALHMDGIRFAFRACQEEEEQHPNVAFLELLSEFSFKLLQQDKDLLMDILKSQCPTAALSWHSVNVYQRSLKGTQAKLGERVETIPSPTMPVTKHQKINTGDKKIIKRQKIDTGGLMANSNSTLDCSSIHSSELPSPILTSTALKQPHTKFGSRGSIYESDVGRDLTEPESDNEFNLESQRPEMLSTERLRSTAIQSGLNTQLNLLLLNDDFSEQEEEAESDK